MRATKARSAPRARPTKRGLWSRQRRRPSGLMLGVGADRLRRLDLCQRLHRRAVENGAVGGELGAVAGAVPAAFEAVPVNDAAHVGAGRRALDQRAVRGTISSDLLEAAADDAAFLGAELV